MWSFIISVCALVLGYLLYGRVVEKAVNPNLLKPTPAYTKQDGVDFVPMPTWKVFMIQFLNIAGTGPIFGAIMGAKFGPSCYLWIVFGSIFAGAVHDYINAMISLRHGGASVPEVIGHYLGHGARIAATILILFLLLLVGAVFVYSPAMILGDLAGFFSSPEKSVMFWVAVIFIYYSLATLLPIDKLIGRIYPFFAFALLFMALSLMVVLLFKWPTIPEFWDGLQNRGPEVGVKGQPIFPCLFITVACGAISGFHSTQSPLMARCIKSEKYARPVFYGSMIVEGMVALVWAAVSSYFFFDGGMAEVGATSAQAPVVVTSVAKSWLGVVGSILAILGVVAAPITSGDTAFRSSRLIVADIFHISQKTKKNRIMVSIPIFCVAAVLLWFNIADENGFNTIWRYFGWANQTLACFTLWTVTAYMVHHSRRMNYLITMLPALFMTTVCVTYLCVDKIGFNMPESWTMWIAIAVFIIADIMSHYYIGRLKHSLKEGTIKRK